MRKLYSGLSRVDASVQLQAWLAPAVDGRVISIAAFRANAELLSETHRVAANDPRQLTELVPSLLAALESRIAPTAARLH
ncbi:MAG: hypothetical protein QE272_01560 [Nevskia sp.]|nr:hypothetical protein [Gammaproteobacteria bacterium]MDH4457369.1 hypothetical protein [Nevskia sp.]